jgi:integrase
VLCARGSRRTPRHHTTGLLASLCGRLPHSSSSSSLLLSSLLLLLPLTTHSHTTSVCAFVCRGLQLQEHRFTPHSLRHGGATHALLHLGQSIETVMHRGRWQSVNSCRIYLQAGRAQLLQQDIDPDILSFADQVAGDWYDTVRDGLHLPPG